MPQIYSQRTRELFFDLTQKNLFLPPQVVPPRPQALGFLPESAFTLPDFIDVHSILLSLPHSRFSSWGFNCSQINTSPKLWPSSRPTLDLLYVHGPFHLLLSLTGRVSRVPVPSPQPLTPHPSPVHHLYNCLSPHPLSLI